MTASLFTVRSATAQDASAVSELEQQCMLESKTYRGSEQLFSVVPLVGLDIDSYCSVAGHIVLVVESQNHLCGFAQMEISASIALVRRIYVSQHARYLGAGATLIEALRVRARSEGCTQIDAYALPGDRLTKNLFERAGMKARLLIASSEL